MTYTIDGAQGFNTSAETAAEALTMAEAAARQFGPITIVGPRGELTLSELRALGHAERQSIDRS